MKVCSQRDWNPPDKLSGAGVVPSRRVARNNDVRDPKYARCPKKVCFEFVFVGSKLFQINCEDKDLEKVFYYCTFGWN